MPNTDVSTNPKRALVKISIKLLTGFYPHEIKFVVYYIKLLSVFTRCHT